jgi:hypothetical protein
MRIVDLGFFIRRNPERTARMDEEKKDPYQEIMDKNIPVQELSDAEIEIMANKAREEIAASKK